MATQASGPEGRRSYGILPEAGLSLRTRRYRECDGCGEDAEVTGGSARDGVVDRRLHCTGCGRSWRQIISD
jgi:hypothetical protein